MLKWVRPGFRCKHLLGSIRLFIVIQLHTAADMSNCMMEVLRQFSPNQEVYSTDECFLNLDGLNADLAIYG